MTAKTCIIITGPTAVGKTAMAIRLATELHTEIISADSRQCFRELNIGVAKPSAVQLQQVKHHFIDTFSIHDEVNAAVFEQYALNAAAEIFEKNDVVIVTGGTGLYIKAFTEGMDDIPAIRPEIREQISRGYETYGIEWLQEKVKENDPGYYLSGEIKNPHRLIRCLEVKLSTGKSIRDFQKKQPAKRNFNIISIGLELPRPQLYANINYRVDEMISAGLVEEARELLPFRYLNALQTVGYRELFDFFEERSSLAEAIENIRKNTRHYAKRQLTWFKKDSSMHWFLPSDHSSILQVVSSSLAGFGKYSS